MQIEKSLFRDKGEKIKNLFVFFDVKLGEKIEVLVEKKGEYNWEKGEVLGADADKEELIIKLLNGEIISLNKNQKSYLEKADEEEIEDEEEDDDKEIIEDYIDSLPPEKILKIPEIEEIMKTIEENETMLRQNFEIYDKIKNSNLHGEELKEELLKRLNDVSVRLEKHKRNTEEVRAEIKKNEIKS